MSMDRTPDLQAFWRLLAGGVDATGDISAARWNADAYFAEDRDAPGKSIARPDHRAARPGRAAAREKPPYLAITPLTRPSSATP